MTRRDLHHEFQVEMMKHLKLHEHLHPELELIHANPMGGKRPKSVGAKLKAEGAKAGIPDLFLPVVVLDYRDGGGTEIKYPGLYIEIKADPKDKLSDAQKWWKPRLEAQGHPRVFARGGVMMTTRIYGASDDLVEIEGDIYEEIGCYGTDDRPVGVLLAFSDGTILEAKYGKLGLGIWEVKTHRSGDLLKSVDFCTSEDAKPYSDVANFRDGLEWVISCRKSWEKIS
jgi:hypothetical protein